MSETDRAFIRAYQQPTAPAGISPRPAAASTSYALPAPTTSPGAQLRVDVPGAVQPKAAAASRVPTPHLQWPAGGSAWLMAEPRVEALSTATHGNGAGTATLSPSAAPWGRASRTALPAGKAPAASQYEGAVVRAASAEFLPSPLTRINETLERLEGGSPTDIQCPIAAADTPAEPMPTAYPCEEPESDAGPPLGTPAEDCHPVVSSTHEQDRGMVDDGPPFSPEDAAPLAACDEPQAEPKPQRDAAPFQPQWEVDAFQWPTTVDRLGAQAHEAIVSACEALVAAAEGGQNLWAVTGVADDCGATTLALTLARHLAAGGLRVALVDADFDNPMVAQRLGIRVEEGWEATLAGRLPADEVSIASVADNLVLLPLVARDGVSSTLASMNAAGQLERLREAFDMVIIDAGSGSENVAALATSPEQVLDVSVLLAVDERRADPTAADEVIARLRHNSLHRVQVAQTFVSV